MLDVFYRVFVSMHINRWVVFIKQYKMKWNETKWNGLIKQSKQAGYMLLEHVSPVTHSVGNCVKRVVVIVASVLFFRTPIAPVNALGLYLFWHQLFISWLGSHQTPCSPYPITGDGYFLITLHLLIVWMDLLSFCCRNWNCTFWCLPVLKGK